MPKLSLSDDVSKWTESMKYVKDPLIISLLFGAAIFGAQRLWDAGSADYRHQIDITPGLRNRILDQWEVQMGRTPTPAEASGLLEQWIKEEIYYLFKFTPA